MKTISIKVPIGIGETVYIAANERENTGKTVKCHLCKGEPNIKVDKAVYQCTKCEGTGYKQRPSWKTVVRVFPLKVKILNLSVDKGKSAKCINVSLEHDYRFTYKPGTKGILAAGYHGYYFLKKSQAVAYAKKNLLDKGKEIVFKKPKHCAC